MPEPGLVRYTLTIEVADGPPPRVRFEPVGPELDLNPGDVLRLDIAGPEGQLIELNQGAGWLQIEPGPGTKIVGFDASGARVEILGFAAPCD